MSRAHLKITPGDHEHLRRLAQERGCNMVDVLEALVEDVEAGRIYPLLSGRGRGNGSKQFGIRPAVARRVKALADAWGVYNHQVVTWLLDHAEKVEPQSPHDIWGDMAALKESYERMIASEGAA